MSMLNVPCNSGRGGGVGEHNERRRRQRWRNDDAYVANARACSSHRKTLERPVLFRYRSESVLRETTRTAQTDQTNRPAPVGASATLSEKAFHSMRSIPRSAPRKPPFGRTNDCSSNSSSSIELIYLLRPYARACPHGGAEAMPPYRQTH